MIWETSIPGKTQRDLTKNMFQYNGFSLLQIYWKTCPCCEKHYLNLAATNADIKWHCQNPDNHNKSIFNPFFFHHICLSIENKNIIVSDKDTHKCQNNCSPQLANC